MKITVEMEETEFARFQEYLADKKKADRANERTEKFASKVLWSMVRDENKKDKVQITDQELAIELFEMAEDYFA